MFVSNMLKKCINLLSPDFSKNNSQSIKNEDSIKTINSNKTFTKEDNDFEKEMIENQINTTMPVIANVTKDISCDILTDEDELVKMIKAISIEDIENEGIHSNDSTLQCSLNDVSGYQEEVTICFNPANSNATSIEEERPSIDNVAVFDRKEDVLGYQGEITICCNLANSNAATNIEEERPSIDNVAVFDRKEDVLGYQGEITICCNPANSNAATNIEEERPSIDNVAVLDRKEDVSGYQEEVTICFNPANSNATTSIEEERPSIDNVAVFDTKEDVSGYLEEVTNCFNPANSNATTNIEEERPSIDNVAVFERKEDVSGYQEEATICFNPANSNATTNIEEERPNIDNVAIFDRKEDVPDYREAICFNLAVINTEEERPSIDNEAVCDRKRDSENQKPRYSLLSYFDPLFKHSENQNSSCLTEICKSESLNRLSCGTEYNLLKTENVNNIKDDFKHQDGVHFELTADNSINLELSESLVAHTSNNVTEKLLTNDTSKCNINISDDFKLSITKSDENSNNCPPENILDKDIEINCPDNTKKMADSDRVNQLEEEIAELKLQLNGSQQLRASLELQLTQKEEVIIKTQTESLRKDQAMKQEIKLLKEKLEEKQTENDITPEKELQENIKLLKSREAKNLSEISNFKKILEDYDQVFNTQLNDFRKLSKDHETVKLHLSNLELAFSDVHQKYERCKKIIEGFKSNEGILRDALLMSEESVSKSEQKYESLKAHAKAQLEKANQEIMLMRDQYENEVHKLTAINKRLEIKISSLMDSLDQKNKECSALAALCDEVTGKV